VDVEVGSNNSEPAKSLNCADAIVESEKKIV
jgi:hypothetical protein